MQLGMLSTVAAILVGGPNATAGPCTNDLPVCQIHLALGATTSDYVISWVSRAASQKPLVEWGTSPAALTQSTAASTLTYALSDLCQPKYVALRGWEAPGFLHHATVRLPTEQPGSFWYRVGDAGTNLSWSDVIGPVHHGGAKRGDEGELTSFAAFGDMGTYSYAPSDDLGACDDQTAAALLRVAPELDVVFHVGDIAYANDGPQSRWRYYMEEIAGTASLVPWMVGCGNHDCLWEPGTPHAHGPTWPGSFVDAGGDGGQCGLPYDSRFRMPGEPSRIAAWEESRAGTVNNLFYNFSVGLVHFVMISSEHDLSEGGTQHAWLAEHLPTVNRTAHPFVVLGLHRPIYSSTSGGAKAPETHGQRTALEPLLLLHRVTVVVAGHYHQYERSCAVAEGVCVDDGARSGSASGSGGGSAGTVHLLAGIAGVTHDDEWVSPTPPWVRAQSRGRFGYARFDVLNRTHMRLTAVEAKDGSVIDEAWILA